MGLFYGTLSTLLEELSPEMGCKVNGYKLCGLCVDGLDNPGRE